MALLTKQTAALWCCYFVILLTLQTEGRPFIVRGLPHARALRQAPLDAASELDGSTSTWIAHECLWSNIPMAAAEATATSEGTATATSEATATSDAFVIAAAQASATASARATAQATGTIVSAKASVSSSARQSVTCSLNPSYFFSLPAPVLDGEKLLLEITAMRYGCLNHTTFATCAADQANWCTWNEETDRCGMFYDDADFVHLLLWSGTKVACNGSKLAEVVNCSYHTSDVACSGQATCAWAEGACYPTWYAPLVNKPRSLAAFKRQVYAADPAVWGSCAGAQLYRSYGGICNHGEEACVADPNCHWLLEYENEVMANPLNFSKPCHLSTTRFPIESVFLGPSSIFSGAVFEAQKECIQARDQVSCTAKQTNLSGNVFEAALQYQAAAVPALTANGTPVADPLDPAAGAASSSNTFVASWAQMGDVPALLQLGPDFKPGSLSPTSVIKPANNGTTAPPAGEPPTQTPPPPAAAAASNATAGAVATASAVTDTVKPPGNGAGPAVNPIGAAERGNFWGALSELLPHLGVSQPNALQANNTTCTTHATCRAAFVSLRKLHVIPRVNFVLGTRQGVPITRLLDVDKQQ